MSARMSGYIAVGLSGDGTMNSGGVSPGSDIWLGYLKEDNTPELNDYYTLKHGLPTVDDAPSSLSLLSYEQSNSSFLSFEFERALSTGEFTQDRDITPEAEIYLLFAAHYERPVNRAVFNKHSVRSRSRTKINFFQSTNECSGGAVVEVNLAGVNFQNFSRDDFLQSIADKFNVSSNTLSFLSSVEYPDDFCPECIVQNLTVNDFHLGVDETQYRCVGFTLNPQAPGKWYIVRLDAIVDNAEVNHHMGFWVGGTPLGTVISTCDQMPATDYQFLWVQGPGLYSWTLPPEVGFQLQASQKYARLEVHYDNPAHKSGLRDSSGIRVWYSPTPRPYALGYFQLAIGFINIPGSVQKYTISYECPASTFAPLFSNSPTGRVHLFATWPHMHQVGAKIWVVQTDSAGLFKSYIVNVQGYRFDSQALYETKFDLFPGDKLRLYCQYDTTNRPEGAVAGPASANEMCGTTFFYYPQVTGVTIGCGPATAAEVLNEYCDFPCLHLLKSPFVRWASGTNPALFAPPIGKNYNGIVLFNGVIMNSAGTMAASASFAAATYDLPRPSKRLLTGSDCSLAFCRFDITKDGEFIYSATATASNYFSIDGIFYDTNDAEYVNAKLSTGWIPYPNDLFFVPAYRKVGTTVYVRGMFGTGSYASQPILFILPPGYRPEKTIVFRGWGYQVMHKITIDPNGEVRFASGLGKDNTFLSIDGVYFTTDDSTGINQYKPVNLTGGFKESGPLEIPPRARIHNMLVHLGGLLTSTTTQTGWVSVGSVPPGMEPPWRTIFIAIAGTSQGPVALRVDITAIGGIELYIPPATSINWVSLDGITYPAVGST